MRTCICHLQVWDSGPSSTALTIAGLQPVHRYMDPFRRQLCMIGHMAELPQVLDFVEESAEDAGVDPDFRFDLQLAAEEACTNVIEHAYGGQGGEIEVCFETNESDVIITIRDHGQSFDPAQVPGPDLKLPLDQRVIGGLGLHLMQQLMDDVQFTFAEDRNTLVMVKRNVIPSTRWADAA
jgi:serine/threonine-protein kinase RsbW